MAFLRTRKGKRGTHYYLVFENKNCKAVGSNLAVARRILAEYHDRLRLAEFGINDPVPCGITLNDLMERDLEQAKRDGKSLKTRLLTWAVILRILPGTMRASEVTPKLIERLDTGDIKRNTLRRRHAFLRYQLGESVRLGEIPSNPFNRVKRIVAWDARKGVALTRIQAARLLWALRRQHGPTARWAVRQLRTASRPGQVPEPSGNYAGHKRGRPRRFKASPLLPRPERCLFSNHAWLVVRERLGMPRLNPKDLRHTALTWAAKKPGASLGSVMGLGGWTTPSVASTYLHLGDDPQETV